MTLQQLARNLRDGWTILLLGLTLGLGGALAASILIPAEYAAQVTLYISAQAPADNAIAAYQGNLLSTQRTASYVELITSERVSRDVIARLHAPLTAEQLEGKLDANSTDNTVVISLTARDTDPAFAASLANTAADSFVQLVAQLEQPPQANRPPTVVARIVQPAVQPTDPVSPSYPLNLAVGAALGLAVAAGFVLLRSRLDTTIRSAAQLEGLSELSNLGMIPESDLIRKKFVLSRADAQTIEGEAFRQLRTNVQFVDLDNANKVLLISSSVPAEGKSSVVCNLASAIAAAGYSVVAVEGDLRRPRLSDYYGLGGSVGVTSVLTGRVQLEDALQPTAIPGLRLLSSGPLPPNPSEILTSRQSIDLISKLRERFNYVLIDSPPLLPVTDAASLSAHVDGVLVVSRFGVTTESQVRESIRSVRAASGKVLGTILSVVPKRATRDYGTYNRYYGNDAEPVDTEERAKDFPSEKPLARFTRRHG